MLALILVGASVTLAAVWLVSDDAKSARSRLRALAEPTAQDREAELFAWNVGWTDRTGPATCSGRASMTSGSSRAWTATTGSAGGTGLGGVDLRWDAAATDVAMECRAPYRGRQDMINFPEFYAKLVNEPVYYGEFHTVWNSSPLRDAARSFSQGFPDCMLERGQSGGGQDGGGHGRYTAYRLTDKGRTEVATTQAVGRRAANGRFVAAK